MPKRKWYSVEKLTGKRYNAGIPEYRVKFISSKREFWTPFYDITTEIIQAYEDENRERKNNERQWRWERRTFKKEMNEALPEIPIRGRLPKTLKWFFIHKIEYYLMRI